MTWHEMNGLRSGRDQTMKRVITADKFPLWTITKKKEVLYFGEEKPFTYALDPAKKPKAIDLRAGKDGPVVLRGIYEVEGDRLKICYGAGERPDKFAARAGSERAFIKLKRVKDSPR
jgi:uncharacterized protein (TIGR03067 family)